MMGYGNFSYLSSLSKRLVLVHFFASCSQMGVLAGFLWFFLQLLCSFSREDDNSFLIADFLHLFSKFKIARYYSVF